MKVLIAEDHPVVRFGVKEILADHLKLCSFGEAQSAKEVFEKVSKKRWDILILDINLPDMNGLDMVKRLKKTHPDLRVLVLTILEEDQIAMRVLKAGACGFITKNTIPAELAAAVKKITEGGHYVSPSLADKIIFDVYMEADKPAHHFLSNREYQVLCFIARGKSVKQIANELYLSVQTIRTYRTRILKKMNMETDAELIHYAIQNHLIQIPSI